MPETLQYIPASNVLRNGEEYVLKITKATLNKMLSPGSRGKVPIESILVLDNLERIANNGVWKAALGDRLGRSQIKGIDHLMTTVYIDNTPYLVDMRVRLVQEAPNAKTDNVLYYFTPEEILSVEKVDPSSPLDKRRALAAHGREFVSTDFNVAQGQENVKNESVAPQIGQYSIKIEPPTQTTNPGQAAGQLEITGGSETNVSQQNEIAENGRLAQQSTLHQEELPASTQSAQVQNSPTERGTGALDKLGVYPRGDKGDYRLAAGLRNHEQGRKSILAAVKKAEKRLDPTKAEKRFALGIASGDYTAGDVPASMSKETVLELADYYSARDTYKDTTNLKERREEIREENEALAEAHFRDADAYKLPLRR